MGFIVDNLKDKLGNILYPRTITEAVADITSGENLNQMLDGVVRGAGDEGQEIEEIEEAVGDAIVRHEQEIDDLEGYIGSLDGLTTTEKSNLVGAINELKNSADTHKDINA